MLTGQQFPVLWTSLALIVLMPLGVFIYLGQPLVFDYPELKGFNFQGGMVMQPEFLALLLGLSIYTASFIAEIVRSGIQGVSKGQKEAALAIGLSKGQSLRLVVIPQAMRIIIPPLTSQFLNLTKNSSLAVAIGYPDLVSVWSGTVLNQTGQAVEVILVTMCVFLTISLIVSLPAMSLTRPGFALAGTALALTAMVAAVVFPWNRVARSCSTRRTPRRPAAGRIASTFS
jgi:general L-amino acid transport system permease protein